MIDFLPTLALNNEAGPLLKANRHLTDERNTLVKGFGHSYATRPASQVPRPHRAVSGSDKGTTARKNSLVDAARFQWLLDLDGDNHARRLRQNKSSGLRGSQIGNGAQAVLSDVCWGNPRRDVRLPSLRCASVLQPGSLMARNNSGQHCGSRPERSHIQGRQALDSAAPGRISNRRRSLDSKVSRKGCSRRQQWVEEASAQSCTRRPEWITVASRITQPATWGGQRFIQANRGSSKRNSEDLFGGRFDATRDSRELWSCSGANKLGCSSKDLGAYSVGQFSQKGGY